MSYKFASRFGAFVEWGKNFTYLSFSKRLTYDQIIKDYLQNYAMTHILLSTRNCLTFKKSKPNVIIFFENVVVMAVIQMTWRQTIY
jgi:hypothetical protein